MEPAYHITLTPDQFSLIGEICAIQAQIDWSMQNTIMRLLGISREAAQVILGSTSIANNSTIWLRVVQEKHEWPDKVAHAELAVNKIKALAEGRNDFVHAIFGYSPLGDGNFSLQSSDEPLDPQTFSALNKFTSALRVRNLKPTPLDSLRHIRDLAAEISIRVAHVSVGASNSPWRRRLAELPDQPVPKA
jgi:hypothetical protein